MDLIIYSIVISILIISAISFVICKRINIVEKKIEESKCISCGNVLGKQDFNRSWGVRFYPRPYDSITCGYIITCNACNTEFRISHDGWIINENFKKEIKLSKI
jgi:hypothetical protein